MLIKLTKLPGRTDLYIHHSMVLIVDKSADNPLQTVIVTSVNLGKGFVQVVVLESAEEIAALVNSADMAERRASIHPQVN